MIFFPKKKKKHPPQRLNLKNMKSSRHLNIFISFSLIAIAAAFIIIGLMRGEQTEVLLKAIRICLECIGIG